MQAGEEEVGNVRVLTNLHWTRACERVRVYVCAVENLLNHHRALFPDDIFKALHCKVSAQARRRRGEICFPRASQTESDSHKDGLEYEDVGHCVMRGILRQTPRCERKGESTMNKEPKIIFSRKLLDLHPLHESS